MHGFYYFKNEIRCGISPQVLSATFHSRSGGWRSRRIEHPFWVLDTQNRGEGQFRVGSNRAPWRQRRACTVHLYAPGTAYWEHLSATHGIPDACYLIFSGGESLGLSSMVGGRTGFASIFDPEGMLFEMIRQIAIVGQAKEEKGFCAVQAQLFRILDMVLQARQTGPCDFMVQSDERPPSPPSLSDRAILFMKDNLGRKITLTQMARALHVSPSSLAHRFQQETGKSPMQVLIQLRIQAAGVLLQHGWKLNDVAQQTGFYDAFHLSRTFRKTMGMSPRMFIQNISR